MAKLRILASSVLIMLCLSQTSPAAIRLWHWENTHQLMVQAPPASFGDQLSGILPDIPDDSTESCLELSNLRLTIHRCEQNNNSLDWQSPENWKVTEAIQSDLNRDGASEIAMVVWRLFEPWPIDRFLPNGGRIAEYQNEAGLSAHLILIGWDGDEYRELWAGSALANPIFKISAIDMDGDGYEELIALEGEYDSPFETGNITIWKWQGFGFTLQDRIEGSYSGYAVYRMDQQTIILIY